MASTPILARNPRAPPVGCHPRKRREPFDTDKPRSLRHQRSLAENLALAFVRQSPKLAGMDEPSDERLMLAYRDGNAAAFETLYRRHRTRLYRHLAHQCGDPRLAEDLYQDIWTRVIAARTAYEPLAKFSTWLYRIAHNRLLDHYRQHARGIVSKYDPDADPDALPAPQGSDPALQAERYHLARRLADALAELPEPQREVFLLAEEAGLGLEEIAATTEVGRETAKSRLRYAVAKLRLALEDLL